MSRAVIVGSEGCATAPPPLIDYPVNRRSALICLGSILGGGLAGCGGGSDGDGSASPVSPEAVTIDPADYWSGIATQSSAQISGRTFSAKWTHTLVPEIGQTPTWSVGTGTGIPTVRDCFGYLRHARLGEARFWGARRVENRIRGSADFGNAVYWWSVGSAAITLLGTDSRYPDSTGAYRTHRLSKTAAQSARVQNVGVLPAVEHTFSVYAKSESLSQIYIQFYVSGGATIASGIFDIGPSGWTRVQVSGTPDGVNPYRILISAGSYNSAAAGSVLICDAQLEDVSGSPSNAASEYIATDRTSPNSWHYGAMVDGVRYFDRYKGNTVAAGIVREANGGLIPSDVLRYLRLEPADNNLCTQTEDFTTWTQASGGVSLVVTTMTNPRCEKRAVRLFEGSQFAETFISLDIPGVPAGAPFTFSCFAKADTAATARLTIKGIDGGSCGVNFDLNAGAVGTIELAAGRQAWAHIEPWADGWYRCVLTTSNALNGAQAMSVRVGIAGDGGAANYQGNGKSIFIWGAQASAVEYPTSYLPNNSGQPGVSRQSQSLEIPNPAAYTLGIQKFVVTLEAVLPYYSGITIKGGSSPAWRPFWYAYASGAYRNQNRLGVGLRPTSVAFFGDRYLGDPNPLYFWRPGASYAVGDIVIPTDTQLDNQNKKKMFVCVVAGLSGAAEPTWNESFVSVPDKVSQLTADGSVRWQNNHDNTIMGMWEPYDTCILNYGASVFPGRHRSTNGVTTGLAQASSFLISSFSAPGAFGYSVNGQNALLRTIPFPIDGTSSGDLHYPMEAIRFGRLNETATSHPVSIGNVVISSEEIGPESNRLRTVRSLVG